MREVTGRDAAVWVGCSMGGYIAMAVAERHPDAVAGLGLLGTKSTADTEEARAKRLEIADAVDGEPGHPDPRAAAEGLVGTQGERREPLVAAIADNVARHSGEGIAWGQRAMAARPDRTEVLRGLDVPAVVAVGSLDCLGVDGDGDGRGAAGDAQVHRAGHPDVAAGQRGGLGPFRFCIERHQSPKSSRLCDGPRPQVGGA